jgi:hypothetical protein
MKIAIIGAGNVGKALGKQFVKAGHEVFYGVRSPEKYSENDVGGKVGTNAEASKEAEIIVLATPFGAFESALTDCGEITGKIIIDTTNPLTMTDKGLVLTMGFETSAGEKIAEFAKGAKVVKCFNSTGFGNMANPRNSMMLVCGNELEANETVRQLAAEIGFETLNIGEMSKARLLEPLAMLWIHLAFTTDLGRDFAFSISRG